jgi:glyceraldehyde 3-phosphate dehydrogenase
MSKVRVAINGFGRIGRLVYRIISERSDMEVVAINGRKAADVHVHLLKYDSIHGRYKNDVKVINDTLFTDNGNEVKVLTVPTPDKMPWKELAVDVAIEATGKFRKREEIEGHISSGARKVLLTVPSKDKIDATIVMGVNEDDLKDSDIVISNASCTTNCLGPMAKVINDSFGIESGLMTTIHAYTNDQNVVDSSHSDLRRARAAAENIIPTSTGAAKAIGEVIPALAGKLNGMAVRVPVASGSLVDLTLQCEKNVSVEAVNEAFKAASEGAMNGILEYTEDPIVSSDIISHPASCIFDAQSTMVMGEKTLKVLAWYDNEWGYSCRVVDLINKAARM